MKLIPIILIALIVMATPAVGAPAAPKNLEAGAFPCDKRYPAKNMMIDAIWDNPSNGTGFTVLKYSRSKSFSDAKYVRPKDLHKYAAQAKGDEIYQVYGLKAKTMYYVKVAQSTFEGERVSDYSKTVSVKTKGC